MFKTALRRAELQASLEELAQFGSTVDLARTNEPAENAKVEIIQVGGIHESQVFELEDGRVACIADLAITNQTSRPIHLVEIELRTSWGQNQWDWLTPQRIKYQRRGKRECSYLTYQFPGKCGLQLEYDVVINHFLLERRSLPSRRPLEGFLLGIGGPMPAELRHGQFQELALSIVGSDHTKYATTIELWTSRLEPLQKKERPRTNLVAQAGKEEVAPRRGVTRTPVVRQSERLRV